MSRDFEFNRDRTMVIEIIQGYLNLEGDIDEVISTIKELKKAYGEKYTNIRIDEVPKRWDEGYEYVVKGDRKPTKEEVEVKKLEDLAAEANRERYERANYEALKKKYEGTAKK